MMVMRNWIPLCTSIIFSSAGFRTTEKQKTIQHLKNTKHLKFAQKRIQKHIICSVVKIVTCNFDFMTHSSWHETKNECCCGVSEFVLCYFFFNCVARFFWTALFRRKNRAEPVFFLHNCVFIVYAQLFLCSSHFCFYEKCFLAVPCVMPPMDRILSSIVWSAFFV